MANLPTQIPDCASHSPALFDLFISSDASICSTIAFSLFGNPDHVIVSVFVDFPSNSKRDADWDGLCNHLRDVPWEHITKLSASTAAGELCEWVHIV